jgi:hypothetical protein
MNQRTQDQISQVISKTKLLDIVTLVNNSGYSVVKKGSTTMTTVEHDSLIIWPERNHFSWYSRGLYGGPLEWLRYVENVSDEALPDYVKDINITDLRIKLIEQEFVDEFPKGHVAYAPYFQERNISEETARLFMLEKYNDDVIIPMYNNKGVRCGSLIRRHDTNISHEKYRKPLSEPSCNLWPYWMLKYMHDKPVFVFEGAWSAMRWYQVAEGKIATLAFIGINANHETLELLNGVKNVTFVLDRDPESEAGNLVMTKLKSTPGYMGKHLGWKFLMPHKYPDEMTDDEVKWYLARKEII